MVIKRDQAFCFAFGVFDAKQHFFTIKVDSRPLQSEHLSRSHHGMKTQDTKVIEIARGMGFCRFSGRQKPTELIDRETSCLLVNLRQAVAQHRGG